MTLIESILQGKSLNFAIDRAAVEASTRNQNPGVVLSFLEQIANGSISSTITANNRKRSLGQGGAQMGPHPMADDSDSVL